MSTISRALHAELEGMGSRSDVDEADLCVRVASFRDFMRRGGAGSQHPFSDSDPVQSFPNINKEWPILRWDVYNTLQEHWREYYQQTRGIRRPLSVHDSTLLRLLPQPLLQSLSMTQLTELLYGFPELWSARDLLENRRGCSPAWNALQEWGRAGDIFRFSDHYHEGYLIVPVYRKRHRSPELMNAYVPIPDPGPAPRRFASVSDTFFRQPYPPLPAPGPTPPSPTLLPGPAVSSPRSEGPGLDSATPLALSPEAIHDLFVPLSGLLTVQGNAALEQTTPDEDPDAAESSTRSEITDFESEEGGNSACQMCSLFPWLTFGPIPQKVPESASLTCRHGDDILTFRSQNSSDKSEEIPAMKFLKTLIPIRKPDTCCEICGELSWAKEGSQSMKIPCCKAIMCYCCAVTVFSGFRVGAPIASAGLCPFCRAVCTEERERIKDLDSLRVMAQFMVKEKGPLRYSEWRRKEWQRVERFLDKRVQEDDDVLCLKGLYTSPDVMDQAGAVVGAEEAKKLNEMMEAMLGKWREHRYFRDRVEDSRAWEREKERESKISVL